MPNIIREYVRAYLSIKTESMAMNRSVRSGSASDVFELLKAHFFKFNKNLVLISSAVPGSTRPDLVVTFAQPTSSESTTSSVQDEVLPTVDSAVWHIEVKSFESDTKLGVEMRKKSAIGDLLFSPAARQALYTPAQSQITKKLSSDPKALAWVQDALKSEDSSNYTNAISFGVREDESEDLRVLKVVRGTAGDWMRVRAASIRSTDQGTKRGQYRSFYIISNEVLTRSQNKFSEKDLEVAIQDDLVAKGDHVLVLHSAASNSIRCYSLTAEAKSAFGFPEFSSGGKTIEPGSVIVTSFAAGARVGVVCEVLPGTGLHIQ